MTVIGSFLIITVLSGYTPAQIYHNDILGSIGSFISSVTGIDSKDDKSSTDEFTESAQYTQGFETDNTWGDPGTDPTRVPSGTNGITSKTGAFHAEASAGDFTRWGGYSPAFPANGFTTSVDIYLDVNGAYANDTRFDYTSAVSNPAGAHRRDFIFHGGFYNDGIAPGTGNRFVVSASNNAPGDPRNPARAPFAISSSGWYTFKHRFYNNGAGVLAVRMSLLDSSGNELNSWTLSDSSDVIGTTVGGNRYGWFASMAFPFLAIDNSVRSNLVQDAPIVVKPGSLNGWSAVSQRTAAGTFTKGPGTAPIGFGGYRMTTGAGNSGPDLPQGGAGQGGKTWFSTAQYAGTLLSSITELRYSTYVAASAVATTAPSLQFQVDIDGNGTRDAALVYEPVYSVDTQGPVALGTWQTWNARTGKWWFTNNGITTGAFCPLSCFNTYSDIIAAYPNAKIINWFPAPDGNGVQFVAGQNSAGNPWINFDGNVDAFSIGIAGDNKTFNFEPTMTTVVDDDGMASAASCDDPTPASNNIADAVLAAAPGDNTVRVCPGNYPLSSQINLNKANLTILGVGAARPAIMLPTSIGHGFTVTAPNVTMDNLEIVKADLGSVHNMILVNANNFTAQNNLIYGPNPGGTWNTTGFVSRAFEVAGGLTGLLIQNNTIHTLRQPAYINTSSGQILNNNVSGTKGWAVDGAVLTFAGNTWGEPQNQDCDIALFPSVNPANYPTRLAMSVLNDNAFICAQYTGGENGRAVAFVDDNAAPGGNGSDNANYQTITAAIAGTLAGGTVEVGPGGYNEDVNVSKSVIVNGSGFNLTTVTGQIGGDSSTFRVSASNVVIRNFKITRAGNNVADWNNPGLNTAGVAVQGATVTGLTLHNNLITGNRTGIDINNSGTHTVRNNVITDNRTGMVFRNQTDNMTVVENDINNNWTLGVIFLDGSSGSNSPVNSALNSTFSNNNISGNWYGQIVDNQSGGSLPAPGTTNLKNFSGNWLGTTAPVVSNVSSSEPGYAAQIPVAYGGSATPPPATQPHIAGTASANLDYSPFLNSGADTDVETTALRGTYGFQGSFNSLSVSATSPQANGSLSNIQEGINLVTAGGTLNILNGTYAGNVNINKVLTLKGTPTILGTLTASVAGARISPGFSPGIINSGSLTLSAGTFVDIELNGTTAGTGYDQINVTGTVDLGGATLNVATGFSPSTGNTFTIINNDLGDAVTGTFQALPEGTVFFIGSNSFKISYVGGDGNDVVLTSVSLCSAVSIPTGVTAQSGSTVTVPVNVDDVTGKGLLSFDTVINYNPAVINAPSVTTTSMTSGRALTVNSTNPGQIIISVYDSQPLSGSGALLNITFNVVGGIGSTSGVNFNSFIFNEGTPCLSTSNGSINVISGTISGNVNYAHTSALPVPGTTLSGTGSVNVSTTTNVSGAYSLSGFGAGAYTVTPSKTGDANGITSNDSALIAQHVAGFTTLNSVQQVVADVSGNGTITSFDAALIARYVVLLPNSGNTGTWRFSPVNKAYASVASNLAGENYSAYLMGDVTGNWTSSITSFAPFVEQLRDEDRVRVILPQISAAEDSSVTIPMDVEATTGRGIISYQFDLVYDLNAIEPQEVFAGTAETLSSQMTVTYNVIGKGRVRVAVFGAAPLEGKGTLLNLNFKTVGKENSSSPLKIENFVFNENAQLALPVDGEIKVSAAEETESVEGQLLTSTGEEIAGEEVVLTDTRGESRSAVSDKSGSFRFGKLTPGETYTISVNSKRYAFMPQSINAADGMTKLNLVAEP